MNQELIEALQTAQRTLDPRFKSLREATAALKGAFRLASDDKADALPMSKALAKLEQAASSVPDEALQRATERFRSETERALGALAFEFAKDLRETFGGRGLEVAGRPPTLVVGELRLQIDIAARKAQWVYGKEPLTRQLPLSSAAIVQAYEQQQPLLDRDTDPERFLQELFKTWHDELASRSRRPAGDRLNLVETYSKLTLNRQSPRFWNAPSRSTFKDYPRAHFVRDLVLARAAPTLNVGGKGYRLRLGVATKSQADSASRSVWVPSSALDGEFYSDITFEVAA